MHRIAPIAWAVSVGLSAAWFGVEIRAGEKGTDSGLARWPVPAADAQQRAQRIVEEVFARKIAEATGSEQKAQVAQEILRVGTDTSDDPAGRFVLYTLARDLASDAGEWELVKTAVLRLEESYEVDALQMKADLTAKIAKTPGGAKDPRGWYPRFREVIEEAVMADRYDVAKSVNMLLIFMAQQTRDVETSKQATDYTRQLTALEAEYGKVRAAREMLQTDADNPQANLAVGRYECFIKGDWRGGLSRLARGSDATLRALAEEELLDRADAFKLGEGWWDVAQTQKGRAFENVTEHSRFWYRKCPPQAGLMKARIEGRLGLAAETPKTAPATVRTSSTSTTAPVPKTSVKATLEADALLGGDREKLARDLSADAVRIQGHRYKLFREELTWTEARDACEKMGGHLAILDDEDERKKVTALNKSGMVWIGASLNENGRGAWLDGRPVELRAKGGDPAENRYGVLNGKGVLLLRPLDGRFKELRVRGFICEWDE